MMRGGSGPQPPSERNEGSHYSKSPRQRGVHFNVERVATEEEELIQAEMMADLQQKVEALSLILNKAKVDREQLLGQIDSLRMEKQEKESAIAEVSKKRNFEEKSFQEILRRERIISDNRISKQKEIIEHRNGLLVELSVFITTLSLEYPDINIQDVLKTTWETVPGALDACRAIRDGQASLSNPVNPEKVETSKKAKKHGNKSKTSEEEKPSFADGNTTIEALTSNFIAEIEAKKLSNNQVESSAPEIAKESNRSDNEAKLLSNLENFIADFQQIKENGKVAPGGGTSYKRPNPKMKASKQSGIPSTKSASKVEDSKPGTYSMISASDAEDTDNGSAVEKLKIIQEMLS